MTWRGRPASSDTGGENQHQAQIEHDALRVVGLAQARFNAGIIAGSRASEARIPRCVSGPMACYCKGSGWMPPFNSPVRWAGLQTLMICAFYT